MENKIEKVARAMCEAAGFNPSASRYKPGEGYTDHWRLFELKAKQFVAAYEVLNND